MRILATAFFCILFCNLALAAPASGKDVGQPLLPQAPKHGAVPMAPLLPPGNDGTDNTIQNNSAVPGYASSMGEAEIFAYAGVIIQLCKWLLLLICAGVIALAANGFYLRRIAIHMQNIFHLMHTSSQQGSAQELQGEEKQ